MRLFGDQVHHDFFRPEPYLGEVLINVKWPVGGITIITSPLEARQLATRLVTLAQEAEQYLAKKERQP